MKRHMAKWVNEQGFTLMELLVVTVVSGVVMAAIYTTYYSQQKSYVAQEQVAGMQQNLRAAMLFMEREIRMAGCDPTGNADAEIITADSNSIHFTLDISGDSEGSDPDGHTDDTNEDITYTLYDYNGDTVNDLGRNTGAGNRLIAENIDALDFVYLDEDGIPIATPVANLSTIRSVQITIVARTGRGDPGYGNNTTYRNQQDTVILAAQNDNVRRRRLTTNIRCRNLGL